MPQQTTPRYTLETLLPLNETYSQKEQNDGRRDWRSKAVVHGSVMNIKRLCMYGLYSFGVYSEWYVHSIGIVYSLFDPSSAYNEWMHRLSPAHRLYNTGRTHIAGTTKRKMSGKNPYIRPFRPHIHYWPSQTVSSVIRLRRLSLIGHLQARRSMRCAGAEFRLWANPISDRILSVSADSKLYFCCRKIFSAYKNTCRTAGVKLRSRFTLIFYSPENSSRSSVTPKNNIKAEAGNTMHRPRPYGVLPRTRNRGYSLYIYYQTKLICRTQSEAIRKCQNDELMERIRHKTTKFFERLSFRRKP